MIFVDFLPLLMIKDACASSTVMVKTVGTGEPLLKKWFGYNIIVVLSRMNTPKTIYKGYDLQGSVLKFWGK